MASDGPWMTAANEGRLYAVPMGKEKYVRFEPGSVTCLGTRDLKSCTAVLLVSTTAAVLAHVTPSCGEPGAKSEDHFGRKMLHFMEIVNANRRDFQNKGAQSCVAYAINDDGDWDEEMLRVTKKMFEKNMRVPFEKIDYFAPKRGINHPPDGTVLIDPAGGEPKIYVEDRFIFQVKEPMAETSGAQTDEQSQSGE